MHLFLEPNTTLALLKTVFAGEQNDFRSINQTMTNSIVEGDGSRAASILPKTVMMFFWCVCACDSRSRENYFHKDAKSRMGICETSSNGHTGFARYIFSYDSKMPESLGKRAIFEGVAIWSDSGAISSYREVANVYTGLLMLGFHSDRLSKIAGRQVESLKTVVSHEHLQS